MKIVRISFIGWWLLAAVGFLFATDELSARPACYKSKDCVGKVGFQDEHNCLRKKNHVGKSWRADGDSDPQSECINR